MNRVNIKYLKVLKVITGVYPVVHTVSYFTDLMLGLYGVGGLYPYYSAIESSILFSVVLFMLSNVFRFCMWHKLLVVNVIICSIVDYMDSVIPYFVDGYIAWYFLILSSSLFSLGSIISLFFKNREINNE